MPEPPEAANWYYLDRPQNEKPVTPRTAIRYEQKSEEYVDEKRWPLEVKDN